MSKDSHEINLTIIVPQVGALFAVSLIVAIWPM